VSKYRVSMPNGGVEVNAQAESHGEHNQLGDDGPPGALRFDDIQYQYPNFDTRRTGVAPLPWTVEG
jgi:hypothetical protein